MHHPFQIIRMLLLSDGSNSERNTGNNLSSQLTQTHNKVLELFCHFKAEMIRVGYDPLSLCCLSVFSVSCFILIVLFFLCCCHIYFLPLLLPFVIILLFPSCVYTLPFFPLVARTSSLFQHPLPVSFLSAAFFV